jgi:hypothetical protein
MLADWPEEEPLLGPEVSVGALEPGPAGGVPCSNFVSLPLTPTALLVARALAVGLELFSVTFSPAELLDLGPDVEVEVGAELFAPGRAMPSTEEELPPGAVAMLIPNRPALSIGSSLDGLPSSVGMTEAKRPMASLGPVCAAAVPTAGVVGACC